MNGGNNVNKKSNNDYLNGMLNIPEFEVLDLTEDPKAGDYLFYVTLKHPTEECPFCNDSSTVKYGKHQRFLRDMNIRGHKVGILVNEVRHRCNNCLKTYVDRISCADEAGKTTLRLKSHIIQEALNKPFLQIEKELDIKATTVKRYFKELIETEERKFVKYSPTVLGIDEAHLGRGMRGVVVDVENHNVIELLKDRKLITISDYLSSLPGSDNIKVVTMDMWRPYKEAVNECLPYAAIVIDRFHVMKEMIGLLNSYKNIVVAQKRHCQVTNIEIKSLISTNADNLDDKQIDKIHSVFKSYPELELAYSVKENFRLIYQCDSREQALREYEQWKADFPSELQAMAPIIKTVENWKNEIFNYFDYKYTNAITESLNNVIKCLVRAGRGYSFDVLRAKVLFGKAKVAPKYSYDKKSSLKLFDSRNISFGYVNHSLPKQELLYGSGADMDCLIEILNGKDNLQDL